MQYQVVLQFPGETISDFDTLIDLEDTLGLRLSELHLVDGHDFGAAEMNIFILTDEPLAAFAQAYDLIEPPLRNSLRAAFRHIESDEYKWLYPKQSSERFSVA